MREIIRINDMQQFELINGLLFLETPIVNPAYIVEKSVHAQSSSTQTPLHLDSDSICSPLSQ